MVQVSLGLILSDHIKIVSHFYLAHLLGHLISYDLLIIVIMIHYLEQAELVPSIIFHVHFFCTENLSGHPIGVNLVLLIKLVIGNELLLFRIEYF